MVLMMLYLFGAFFDIWCCSTHHRGIKKSKAQERLALAAQRKKEQEDKKNGKTTPTTGTKQTAAEIADAVRAEEAAAKALQDKEEREKQLILEGKSYSLYVL